MKNGSIKKELNSSQSVDRCVRCGMCLSNCPVYCASKYEPYSPRGILELLRAYTNGGLICKSELVSVMRKCIFCLQCMKGCPAQVDFDIKLIQSIVQLNREGIMVFDEQDFNRTQKITCHEVRHFASEKVDFQKRGNTDILLFTGCFMSQDEEKNLQKALTKIGQNTFLPNKELCCSLPHLLQGNLQQAEESAANILNYIHYNGIKTVVTPCPLCLKVFQRYYPVILNKTMDINFIHISDLFISNDLQTLNAYSKHAIAYHTPCSLDSERAKRDKQIVKKLSDNSFINISENICCGFGFGTSPYNATISKAIGQSSLNKLIKYGIKLLITDCPACTKTWREHSLELGSDIQIMPFWRWMLYT